jgi:hypothetical protein
LVTEARFVFLLLNSGGGIGILITCYYYTFSMVSVPGLCFAGNWTYVHFINQIIYCWFLMFTWVAGIVVYDQEWWVYDVFKTLVGCVLLYLNSLVH